LTYHILTCEACEDGRICEVKTNRAFKQDPETCLWSNTVGRMVYAPFLKRVSPADIPKPKKEIESDG
jgi:hypothetical protein